jgi:phthiocerol/phenolphthiocerol synthesis type-I polyketide synthase D
MTVSTGNGRDADLSPLKRAYLALEELQERCRELEQARSEPIAVVGLACRLPGGADTPAAYWQLLQDGVDAVCDVPADRWDVEAWYDPDPAVAGKMCTRAGGYLRERVDLFDPQFFGISPREAESMDPQHRLLLEVAWEALEDAAQIEDRLATTPTGVFIGITSHDYGDLHLPSHDAPLAAHIITGNAHNAAAGRLSYCFGFQGPCMALDTACSSSLVAVHLACRSLLAGECRRALVGGVNLILSPIATVALSQGRVLAPDGCCRAFDAAASGMVRGEGCAVVVLKRLSHALQDRDHIRALIRGSAINQDGPSSGLTVPNGPAQETLIRQALAGAGLRPEDIDYIEAHGTGTPLGDPIELRALAGVFGSGRNRPIAIGSVKTNIGHLEACAGLAGLIKVVLALQHGAIPRHLHFHDPTPHLPWTELAFVVPTSTRPWPRNARARRAGISSFGFSGVNAHVVLEEAPAAGRQATADDASATGTATRRPLHLLALSGRSAAALRASAERMAEHLARHDDVEPGDVCFSAGAGRAHAHHRLAVVAASTGEMRDKLARFLNRLRTQDVDHGCASTPPKIAFLFTGQGAQYAGMGRELYESQPTFRRALQHCDAILQPLLRTSLLQVLYSTNAHTARLDDTAWTQPALFAIEYALAEVWRSWGIRPDVVLGHSLGEYVAACIAGVFSLEDGLRLIAERARLMQGLPADDALEASLRQVSLAEPRIALVSNLSGSLATAEIAQPAYWRQHVGQPVRFAQCIETARQKGCSVFLELGPKPVLLGLAQPCLAERRPDESADPDPGLLPSLRPGHSDWEQMLGSMARLYVRGARIDWAGFERDYHHRRVALPTTPFQRRRYWPEPARSHTDHALTQTQSGGGQHPLLGGRLALAGSEEIRFQSRISGADPVFLQDHVVFGEPVLPASAYLEMAVAAACAAFASDGATLENVRFERPLRLPGHEVKTLQTVLRPQGADACRFEIYGRDEARPEDRWARHTTGLCRPASPSVLPPDEAPTSFAENAGDPVEVSALYQRSRACGIDLGPRFQALRRTWHRQMRAVGEIALPPTLATAAQDYHLHPVLLDAAFQAMGAVFADIANPTLHIPVAMDRLQVYRRVGATGWSRVRVEQTAGKSEHALRADVELWTADGELVAMLEGLQLKQADRERLLATGSPSFADWLYQVEWQQVPRAATPERRPDHWLILAPTRSAIARDLCARIEQVGGVATVVHAGDSFQRLSDAVACIDPENPEHFCRLLDEMAAEGRPAARIVQMWGTSSEAAAEFAAGRPGMANRLGWGAALHVVQAVTTASRRPLPELWLVTRGAQPVDGRQVVPGVAQAPLLGFGKVVSLEYSDMRCACIDLDHDDEEHAAQNLFDEIRRDAGEDQVAFRAGHRYVARLVHHSAAAERSRLAVRPDGAYLITGGHGGLGLRTAKWLVARGARFLVLVGRRDAGADILHELAELRRAGAVVESIRADVSDAGEIARVLAQVETRLPALRGIIHAAGVLDDGALAHQSTERFNRVLAPKMQGAWHLHVLTRHLPLDFFVLYSSMASMLGSPGQANYVAANAFLDALAHHRRGLGLPALAINWGPWSDIGMAARRGPAGHAEGFGTILPAQGMQILEHLLASQSTQVGVAAIDWPVLAGAAGASRPSPFLANFRRRPVATADRPQQPPRPWPDLTAATPARRRAHVTAHLRAEVAAVVRLGPDDVDMEQPLNRIGLDSLMAVELRNRLRSQLGLDVPLVAFMDDVSIADLASQLSSRLAEGERDGGRTADPSNVAPPSAGTPPPIALPDAEPLLARLDQLTDEEVDMLLSAALAEAPALPQPPPHDGRTPRSGPR